MSVVTEYLSLSTKGDTDIIDVTGRVQDKVRASGLRAGLVTVSVIGSTAGVTTCEYEPGLVQDLKDLFNRWLPAGAYHHDRAWGDGNGHSHLRAALLGPALTLPFADGQVLLGTWQQIVLIDFDNRSRKRQVAVQILGEA